MSDNGKDETIGVVLLICLACWCFCAFLLGYESGTNKDKPVHNCVSVYASVLENCVNRITNMNKNGNTSVCAVAAKQAADICTSSLIKVAE